MRKYSGKHLAQIAFPMGGIGAGTICLQGTGALGNVAVRHAPNYKNTPNMFSALSVKTGDEWTVRVVEAPVPDVRVFACTEEGGLGLNAVNYGMPRFAQGDFTAHFPFAQLNLSDDRLPVSVQLTGWSPFAAGDEDASSLPFAAIEYTFENLTDQPLEAVYYFASENWMKQDDRAQVRPVKNGFVVEQPAGEAETDPAHSVAEQRVRQAKALAMQGAFAAQTDERAYVDACWIRGGWPFDTLTLNWKRMAQGLYEDRAYHDDYPLASPGATLAVPFTLEGKGKKTITLRLCWYVPHSGLHVGIPEEMKATADLDYQPWYAGQYASIDEAVQAWDRDYRVLRDKTEQFTRCFFDTTLPEEIPEAVAANLSILKSPTVMRQKDGRFWGWEGCADHAGSCHGTCTHVWNYQQAVCNLFPRMERSLRETEFFVSQSEEGHQNFRAPFPIQVTNEHDFHAACDGQLGGVVKTYRDWRISGDTAWLAGLFPRVRQSLDYCIRQWDPAREGVLKECHHNTYDIEFWGADGMCSSFYLAALKAACLMGDALGEDTAEYDALYRKGRRYLEEKLFNGEYFYQQLEYDDEKVRAARSINMNEGLSPEVATLLDAEGPRYQYGTGCISDGVLGFWLGEISGLKDLIDEGKLRKNLESIFRYNFRRDLSTHANPQRPGYAMNHDGGLLLCSWPHGGKPSLPFVYSDEVWTGIEYQVASHLMGKGFLEEGLTIVRTLRARYDGAVRNPFDEYECGHWYARAMASYALLQGYSGVRYDAVDKALHVRRHSAPLRTFLSTEQGFGTVTVDGERVEVKPVRGSIDVQKIVWDE